MQGGGVVPNKNIKYSTKSISEYFCSNRRKWDDFYASEKWILERIAGPQRNMGRVLDVGCAAGGLGVALSERFAVAHYTGVDINAQAIEVARERSAGFPVKDHDFICGDILEIDTLQREGFENVFSLSCADWNVATGAIIGDCWKYVRKDGHFVLTLRLSPGPSLLDLSESFQYVYFGGSVPEDTTGIEKAPYVVFNIKDALSLLSNLQPKPARITAYGYWGVPSLTARTNYDRLVFAALAVYKGRDEELSGNIISGEFHLPADLFL